MRKKEPRKSVKKVERTDREETLVRAFEEDFGVDLEVRGDMKLETYFRRLGYPELAKALKKSFSL